MKDKVKDKNKKELVEAYQKGVREAIEDLKSKEGKMSQERKRYIQILDDNIKRASYLLGYLHWPEDKKKKGS